MDGEHLGVHVAKMHRKECERLIYESAFENFHLLLKVEVSKFGVGRSLM